MGNPTTYRGKTLTWRGKQLTGITAGTNAISYSYDENGLRMQKTVNNVATNYYYNGSVLIGLVKGSDTLRFSYDAAGLVQAVDHNGTYYYYLRNGQGDIVKLIDGSGNTVVEYSYDSWGKPLSCTGTLATTLGALNPFRYRGYVYDEETQWYYLKSRYYDPETCRFISADVYLSTGQGVLGHNCYVYCLNNPVNGIDRNGKIAVLCDDENSYLYDSHRSPEEENNAVIAKGLGLTLEFILAFSLCVEFTRDPKTSKLKAQLIGGYGLGTFGASVSLYKSYCDAPSYEQYYNSSTIAMGGTITEFGTDRLFLTNKETGELYSGRSIYYSLVGFPTVEAHVIQYDTIPFAWYSKSDMPVYDYKFDNLLTTE